MIATALFTRRRRKPAHAVLAERIGDGSVCSAWARVSEKKKIHSVPGALGTEVEWCYRQRHQRCRRRLASEPSAILVHQCSQADPAPAIQASRPSWNSRSGSTSPGRLVSSSSSGGVDEPAAASFLAGVFQMVKGWRRPGVTWAAHIYRGTCRGGNSMPAPARLALDRYHLARWEFRGAVVGRHGWATGRRSDRLTERANFGWAQAK